MESTSNRMSRLLRQEYYYHKFISMEETLKKIDSVGKEDIIKLANEMLSGGKLKTAFYGPKSI
jgi:predicted Zn-dependent peptidase